MVKIFTDGSYDLSKSMGGFAFVVTQNGEEVDSYSEIVENSTSNRMELRAVIEAIKYMKGHECTIFSDSSYVVRGFNEWSKNWKKRGWKRGRNRDVLNKDLWIELDNLRDRPFKLLKIKAHAGHEFNERADALAGNY